MSGLTTIKDVRNRIYQQEVGARSIHTILSGDQGAKNRVRYALTATTTGSALESTRLDLLQKQHQIVDALNTQYEDFYIYGGNDKSTRPFTLSEDGTTLTYTHTFPGDSDPTSVTLELQKNADGTYGFVATGATGPGAAGATGEAILARAMQEQGRMDVGYGSIFERDSLIDTFTGGLNVLTGVTSDAINEWPTSTADSSGKSVLDYLNESALALTGQAALAIKDFQEQEKAGNGDKTVMHDVLGKTLEAMTDAEQTLTTVYSDLGNKYKLLDDTESRLNDISDALKVQYKDTVGADPYEAIMEMFNNQYAYNASLQIGSKLMGSSLFDFMG